MHRSGWTVDERAQYVAFGYKQSYDMLMNVISQFRSTIQCLRWRYIIAQVYDGTKHS